ncbi:hypothetical protein R1sor_017910 [Riccia sorocarpa]|uniref:Zonadhesin n=1 Tax=Riccia sorocarpa TaxID=122646 RepID=A0ABD3I8A4_9MARC
MCCLEFLREFIPWIFFGKEKDIDTLVEVTETEVTSQGTMVTAEVPTQASGETPSLPESSLPVQNETATAAPQEESGVTDLPEVTPVEAQKEETVEVEVTPDVTSPPVKDETGPKTPNEFLEITATAAPQEEPGVTDLPEVTPVEAQKEETVEVEVTPDVTSPPVKDETGPKTPNEFLEITATAAPQEEPGVTDLPEVTPVEAQKEETVEVEVTPDVTSPPVKDETESIAPVGEPIAKSGEADLPDVTPAKTHDGETTETEVTSQGTTVTAEVPTQASGETPSLPESSLPVQNETEMAPPVTGLAVVSHENELLEESVIVPDEEDIAAAEVTPELGVDNTMKDITPKTPNEFLEITATAAPQEELGVTDLPEVTPVEAQKEETVEVEVTPDVASPPVKDEIDLTEGTPVEARKEETVKVEVTPDVASPPVKDETESTAPIAKSGEADLPKVTPVETHDEETTETEVTSQGTMVTAEVPTQALGETPSLPESSLPVQNETGSVLEEARELFVSQIFP